MIMKVNRHELRQMKAYAEQLGVGFRFDTSLNARLDGNLEPTKHRIPPEDVVRIEFSDQRTVRGLVRLNETCRGLPPRPNRLYHCGAGSNAFHVDSCGNLTVCMMSRRPSWDLRRGTFRQGWLEFIPGVLARQRRTKVPCMQCDISCLCEQCPGWAQLESGDPEAPVEYLCKIAHLRSELLKGRGDLAE